MNELFGRVFGSCFRTFWWQDTATNNKHIDYIPNRKWRYGDQNLMKELSDHNSWDIMDLTDDEFVNGQIASTGKLRLNDNVFLNPLSADNNNVNRSRNCSNTEQETHANHNQEILRTEHTTVKLVPASTSSRIDEHAEKISADELSTENISAAEISCHTADVQKQQQHEVVENELLENEDQKKLIAQDEADVDGLNDSTEKDSIVNT